MLQIYTNQPIITGLTMQNVQPAGNQERLTFIQYQLPRKGISSAFPRYHLGGVTKYFVNVDGLIPSLNG